MSSPLRVVCISQKPVPERNVFQRVRSQDRAYRYAVLKSIKLRKLKNNIQVFYYFWINLIFCFKWIVYLKISNLNQLLLHIWWHTHWNEVVIVQDISNKVIRIQYCTSFCFTDFVYGFLFVGHMTRGLQLVIPLERFFAQPSNRLFVELNARNGKPFPANSDWDFHFVVNKWSATKTFDLYPKQVSIWLVLNKSKVIKSHLNSSHNSNIGIFILKVE